LIVVGYYVTSAAGLSGSKTYHTGVIGKAGTSMATPSTAAMAAIVRQYFMQGYYSPTGEQNETAYGFTPSAALLKAIIISSGQQMTSIFTTSNGGSTHSSTSIADLSTGVPYPNNNQGYGRVQVNSVLNFGAATLSPLTLFVIGDNNPTSARYRTLARNAAPQIFAFTVSSTQMVRITLAYTDIPCGSGTCNNIIQNDLGLNVTDGTNSFTPVITSKNTYKVMNTLFMSMRYSEYMLLFVV
jgi:hypothetical protein